MYKKTTTTVPIYYRDSARIVLTSATDSVTYDDKRKSAAYLFLTDTSAEPAKDY